MKSGKLKAGQSISNGIVDPWDVPNYHIKVKRGGYKEKCAHEAHEVGATREAGFPDAYDCEIIAVEEDPSLGPL